MPDYDNKENVKMSIGSLLLGLLLGMICPPFGWITAFLLHKKYVKDNDLSSAKGIKAGALISGICLIVLVVLFGDV